MTRTKDEANFHLGEEHLTIQHRYEALGAINDLLIAVWFLIGSFFFLSDSLMTGGTWLFIVGSGQLLIKPAIKLAAIIHVRRAAGTHGSFFRLQRVKSN